MSFALDPRLVESWTYDVSKHGVASLIRAMCLPDGVKAEVLPPVEKRISIGGKFLDEVSIRCSESSYLLYPVERHRATISDDGIATVQAKMPSALQLFAEGSLPPIRGGPVDLIIGGQKLGPMVLTGVRYISDDVAALVFEPSNTSFGGD